MARGAVLEAATETELESEQLAERRTGLAPQWKVLLHNDEVTTFEFVIELLITLFRKDAKEALRLTYEVHDSGSALIVVTSFERAELYVEQVRSLARGRGYPLVASMEPA
jgi:ATP-dependent Clp protease adaptor protein ClpS